MNICEDCGNVNVHHVPHRIPGELLLCHSTKWRDWSEHLREVHLVFIRREFGV